MSLHLSRTGHIPFHPPTRTARDRCALISAFFVFCTMMTALAAAPSLAQVTKEASNDELAVQSEDPTAPLMTFQVEDWYQASLYDKNGSINQAVFRTVIPFTVGSVDNIFRFTEQD